MRKVQMKQLTLIYLLILLFTQHAWAATLTEAKASGLVGEGNKGYVGFITKSPGGDLKSLVTGVNQKRKSKFVSAARKSGASLKQVAHRFYIRAITATRPGDYYQDTGGKWIKK